jgi:uncharacterized Zn finger protein (UPF0148 family)
MHCENCGVLLIRGSETCMICGRPNPSFMPKVVQFTDPISESSAKVQTRYPSSRIHFILTPSGRRVY